MRPPFTRVVNGHRQRSKRFVLRPAPPPVPPVSQSCTLHIRGLRQRSRRFRHSNTFAVLAAEPPPSEPLLRTVESVPAQHPTSAEPELLPVESVRRTDSVNTYNPYPSLAHWQLFSPSAAPPARPNTDPRCNVAPALPHDLPRVSSSLQYDAWEFFLRDYPDQSFVRALLHIVRYGCRIGFTGPEHTQDSTNLRSALDDPDFVTESVNQMRNSGAAHGPFAQPPLPDFRISPLGCATRKRSGKRRLINHLSWPSPDSVNAGIPDSEAAISYERFDTAIRDVRSSGKGSLLAKLDLKSAFHHIPIAVSDWHYMGWKWGDIYFAVVLIFGLRSAPYIFNLFAEALHWIIQRHIPARLRHYLDDFLGVFSPDTDGALAHDAVEWIVSLGRMLGLRFQDEKTVWPTTCLEFLGLEIDTIAMEARLPPAKLAFLQDLLAEWDRRQTCTLRELQELTGYLHFVSQVIPYSRALIQRLNTFSSSFKNCPFTRRHITSAARADIRWWIVYSSRWNGTQLIDTPRPTFHVYTDASGTKGLGGWYQTAWFSTRCPRRMRPQHIQVKEMYAVIQAVMRWGHTWSQGHVVFTVDNKAVHETLLSHTCRSDDLMHHFRLLIQLAAQLNFTFSSAWISSEDNAIADAASRFDFQRMFSLAPYLSRTQSPSNPDLLALKRLLSSGNSHIPHPQRNKSFSPLGALHTSAPGPLVLRVDPVA